MIKRRKFDKGQKVYAMYRGEDLLATGSLQEIADEMGISLATARFYRYPTAHNRGDGNWRVIIELEED